MGRLPGGGGGFQLFDGLVNHKVLRVHQVRYEVENLPAYDAAWIGAGVLLIVVGLVALVVARRSTRASRRSPGSP